jgi:hypothetical protein
MGEGKSDADRIAAWKWQPGQSGNLKGRTKKRPLTSEYENVLASPAPVEVVAALSRWGARKGATWAQCIAISRAKAALLASGNGTLAAKEMREACEGKSTKRMEFVTAEERAITISVEYEEPRTSRPVLEESRLIDAKVSASESQRGTDTES